MLALGCLNAFAIKDRLDPKHRDSAAASVQNRLATDQDASETPRQRAWWLASYSAAAATGSVCDVRLTSSTL